MSRVLAGLTCAGLRTLASAAASGRLGPPYSSVAVGRLLGPDVGAEVAAELERLCLDPPALARVLGMIEAEREAAEQAGSGPELVWTGPEVPGSASRDTGVVVRELFSGANKSVLVAGFAVYQGKDVFESLARRMEEVPGLAVKFFLNIQRPQGNQDLEQAIVRDFVQVFRERQWPGQRLPSIYYDPRSLAIGGRERAALHAKCIVVDDLWAFVTSANLTTAAQERNIEAGLLVREGGLARKLTMQFEALADTGVLKPVSLSGR